MPRFLIEVPHSEDALGCLQAVGHLLTTGSHFLTNADWGCGDGVHKAWVIVDLDSREEARSLLPPQYRTKAQIIRLEKFRVDEIEEMLKQHQEHLSPTGS